MATRRGCTVAAEILMRSLVLVLLSFLLPSPVKADLFFSEYIEGSSNNKALEIYNGTGSSIDLTDGNYAIKLYFNGATNPGLSIPLNGSLANGDVFVVAHSSAQAEFLAQADQTVGATLFNGDDAIALFKGTEIIDVIGQIGFDPGTEWGTGVISTADNTLRRKPSVMVGDPIGSNAFDPSIEWEGFATDTVDGLGTHAGASPVPVPAAIWLFGPGLVGLLSLKRRIKS